MASTRRRVDVRKMLVLGAATLAVTACAPLAAGDWGDILLGGLGNTVSGEIRSIDTRRNSLSVREDYGSTRTVRFDGRTRVYVGQRESRINVLERGDRVRIRLEEDRRGDAWADRIEVQDSRSGRDPRGDRRGDVYGRVERVSGEVRQVSTRQRYFVIRQGRGGDLAVYVPTRLDRDDQRRFERLRRGNRVTVEVRQSGRGQAQLVRFR